MPTASPWPATPEHQAEIGELRKLLNQSLRAQVALRESLQRRQELEDRQFESFNECRVRMERAEQAAEARIQRLEGRLRKDIQTIQNAALRGGIPTDSGASSSTVVADSPVSSAVYRDASGDACVSRGGVGGSGVAEVFRPTDRQVAAGLAAAAAAGSTGAGRTPATRQEIQISPRNSRTFPTQIESILASRADGANGATCAIVHDEIDAHGVRGAHAIDFDMQARAAVETHRVGDRVSQCAVCDGVQVPSPPLEVAGSESSSPTVSLRTASPESLTDPMCSSSCEPYTHPTTGGMLRSNALSVSPACRGAAPPPLILPMRGDHP